MKRAETGEMLPPIYRLSHLLVHLGFVDLYVECSTICLMEIGPRWLGSWTSWWNIQIKVHVNEQMSHPVFLRLKHPCQTLVSLKMKSLSAGELPAFGRYVGGAGVVPAAQPAILQQFLGRTQKPASAWKTLRIQACRATDSIKLLYKIMKLNCIRGRTLFISLCTLIKVENILPNFRRISDQITQPFAQHFWASVEKYRICGPTWYPVAK